MRQRNTFSDFIDSFFSNDIYPYAAAGHSLSASKPAMNVLETDDAYRIELATPGLCKEDISIKLDEDDDLFISFDKREEKSEGTAEGEGASDSKEVAVAENKPVRYLRREIIHQNFVQKLGLPDDVKRDSITASMENGLLIVEIPKIKEEDRAKLERSIDIK